VTICANDHRCLFGEIDNENMVLNNFGNVVHEEWIKSFVLRRELKQDEFMVMPNHFHAIVRIIENNGLNDRDIHICHRRDVARYVSTDDKTTNVSTTTTPDNKTTNIRTGRNDNSNVPTNADTKHNNKPKISAISPKSDTLSTIVRSFKSAVTNRMHAAGFNDNVWQPRFHDHIIRNDRELFAIRQYIKNNPANWANDRNVIETSGQKTGKQPWFVYMG
jgi:putative transposase